MKLNLIWVCFFLMLQGMCWSANYQKNDHFNSKKNYISLTGGKHNYYQKLLVSVPSSHFLPIGPDTANPIHMPSNYHYSLKNVRNTGEFLVLNTDLIEEVFGKGVSNDKSRVGWYKEKKNLDSIWQTFLKKDVKHLMPWRHHILQPIIDEKLPHKMTTVFYPFGGPDISYPLLLFPNATTYINVAQQTFGDLNDFFSRITKQSQVLEELKKALTSLLVRSFFITSDMSKEINASELGVMPLMVYQIKHLGYHIQSIQNLKNNKGVQYGFEIIISKNPQKLSKRIVYLRRDLTNSGTFENDLQDFLPKDHTATFLKAASFLMYYPGFLKIKKYIMNKSSLILEDASGIPYKDNLDKGWESHLFGMYTKPMPLFKQHKDIALAELYQKEKKLNNVKELPFKIGYGYSKLPSHLMLFIKKSDRVS